MCHLKGPETVRCYVETKCNPSPNRYVFSSYTLGPIDYRLGINIHLSLQDMVQEYQALMRPKSYMRKSQINMYVYIICN